MALSLCGWPTKWNALLSIAFVLNPCSKGTPHRFSCIHPQPPLISPAPVCLPPPLATVALPPQNCACGGSHLCICDAGPPSYLALHSAAVAVSAHPPWRARGSTLVARPASLPLRVGAALTWSAMRCPTVPHRTLFPCQPDCVFSFWWFDLAMEWTLGLSLCACAGLCHVLSAVFCPGCPVIQTADVGCF